MGAAQRRAVYQFCHIMAISSAHVLYVDLLDRITVNIHRAICLMDREFPETLKVSIKRRKLKVKWTGLYKTTD